MKIKFIGASREVTGSKHLITTDAGKRILLDCGMFQGKGLETDQMNRNLTFNPKELDFVILSHAHIDHSGLIPYLYKQGFRGSVICTNATRDLCSIMLTDSAHIQELDAKWYNKKADRKKLQHIAPIYTVNHAERCMELFIGVAYNRRFRIDDQTHVTFINSGHVLGSAVVFLEIEENGQTKRLGFTGDVGRPHNRLLRAPEAFPQCDYLITESTYGDRLHPADAAVEDDLLQVVMDTCVRKGGKLIIPSFSIGRTQEIVYVLNKFYNEKRLPKLVDVFVDSPLSVNATEIFRMHTDSMNDDVKQTLLTDPNPFGFNTLKYITKAEESKKLNTRRTPCIIISASGMMEAGRIKHHVANNISNWRNTVLIVGYCTPSSLGARIQQKGLREISIFGIEHKVKADICKIEGFSGHADYQELIAYLSCQDKKRLKKIFVVHGEYDVQQQFREHLQEQGFENIEIPSRGQEFDL